MRRHRTIATGRRLGLPASHCSPRGCGGGGPGRRRRQDQRRQDRAGRAQRPVRASTRTCPARTASRRVKMADRRLQGEVRRQGGRQEHRGRPRPTTRTSPTSPTPRRRRCTTAQGADIILDVPTSSAALAVATSGQGQEEALHRHRRRRPPALTGKQCNKYTFHWAYNTYMLAHGTGTTVTQDGGKNWYIVYPDYAFGQDMTQVLHRRDQEAGGTVVSNDPDAVPERQLLDLPHQGAGLSPKPRRASAPCRPAATWSTSSSSTTSPGCRTRASAWPSA